MAKRGRPPKLNAKRKPCGRLAVFVDEGHEMVLQHRADEVGEYHKHSRFAGYVIGRLYLAGAFGDDEELAERRHNALRDYADRHRKLYGPGTAQSTMRDLAGARGRSLAGGDQAALYAKHRVCYAALMVLPPGPGCRLLTHQVVERAALYEMGPASPAELACLVRGADCLLSLEAASRPRRDKSDRTGTNRHESRRDRMLAIYTRERFGPSDEELAEALARFTALSGKPVGSA